MSSLNSPKILSKEDANTRVVEFSPQEFPQRMSQAAVEFVRFQNTLENPDFKIDRVVSITTGIHDLEKVSLSERVEIEALERLKQLQEEAYQQGYDLGRDEGQESAYFETKEMLTQRLSKIDEMIVSLESLKTNLCRQNEAALVTLTYQIASKIVMDEIKQRPELILPVILQASTEAQNEENITIQMSSVDLEFIESVRDRLGQEFAFLKKSKLEAHSNIQPGGCVVVTNFGQVDATVGKRLDRVWAAVQQKLPKTNDVVTADRNDGKPDSDGSS